MKLELKHYPNCSGTDNKVWGVRDVDGEFADIASFRDKEDAELFIKMKMEK